MLLRRIFQKSPDLTLQVIADAGFVLEGVELIDQGDLLEGRVDVIHVEVTAVNVILGSNLGRQRRQNELRCGDRLKLQKMFSDSINS